MSGDQWESARGTIVESRIEQRTDAGQPGLHQVRVYVVDVRRPHDSPLRATVQSPYGVRTELAPGLTVWLEVNAKTGEIRFEPDGPATPAATFSSPADSVGIPTSPVGSPGGSVSFSSPAVAPPSFEPGTPASRLGRPAGGAFSAGGSFSSPGQDSKPDRIARLEDQRGRGQLTQQEFEARRQQIMDEI